MREPETSWVQIPADLLPGTRIYETTQQLPMNMAQTFDSMSSLAYVLKNRTLYQPSFTYGWMQCWKEVECYKLPDEWADEFELEEADGPTTTTKTCSN